VRLDARLSPRLPLRAPAQLVFSSGRLAVVAEDFAPGGCGLLSPMELRRGLAVFLTVKVPGAAGFSAHATVAWAAPGTPHRTGVAFGPDRSPERDRSLRAILDALSTPVRAFSALHPETWLRATRFADPGALSREEREVLAAVMDGGATVLDLLRRAPGPGTRRALLRLRSRGLVAEGLGPLRPRRRAPALDPGLGELDLTPFPKAAARSRRAASCLEMAREERAAGHLAAALAWLQAAAEEAPSDPEIAAELDALTLVMGY
jgi:hypothetical protein